MTFEKEKARSYKSLKRENGSLTTRINLTQGQALFKREKSKLSYSKNFEFSSFRDNPKIARITSMSIVWQSSRKKIKIIFLFFLPRNFFKTRKRPGSISKTGKFGCRNWDKCLWQWNKRNEFLKCLLNFEFYDPDIGNPKEQINWNLWSPHT